MNLLAHFAISWRQLKAAIIDKVLNHRIQYHNPSLRSHHSVIWNYGYHWLDSIKLGQNVVIMAHAEIVVYKHTLHSGKEGAFIAGDNAVIGTGVNLRAAGGIIQLGNNSGIGELTVVVAANHAIEKGQLHLKTDWDEEKTDVILGDNVWVGANCSLLPGCRIGDNSVIGAGSVVTREVPANEIWAGVPARKIRDL